MKEIKDYTLEEIFQYCKEHITFHKFGINACENTCPFGYICTWYWEESGSTPLGWESILYEKRDAE